MIIASIEQFPLALAVIAFVPAYLAGAKLQHPHAAPLAGFAGAFVVYLAAKAMFMIAIYLVLPVALVVLYVRLRNDLRHWGEVFASECGVRWRQFRRPSHVNDAIDRLLDRRDVVNRELAQVKDSGGNRRHIENRLCEELLTIDRTLEDLL